MNKTVFLQLYKTLIRSIVDYGIVVWFPTSEKNIQLIENIQKRATKIGIKTEIIEFTYPSI